MEDSLRTRSRRDPRAFFHFERPRLNRLFTDAVKYPLVAVSAGTGYGKTSAVHDFVEEYQVTTAWIQLSERDNSGARFWESYTHTMSQISRPFAEAIGKLGFPDTPDMLNRCRDLMREYTEMKRLIIVMDDFHLIEDSSVIRFVERTFFDMAPGTSLFLISRSTPRINTAGPLSRGQMFNISEKDLRFTDDELARYFRWLDISIQPDSLREIIQDTGGWAFAINLVARSYQKAPGYGGYLRNAMKTNIFLLMESEIWDGTSKRLQNFLIRLSLIDHLSVDLITLLADEDKGLLTELEKQNEYVRRDSYINAYVIHHLFLEFLATKKDLLTKEEKKATYTIAGDWCNKNGFKIDALSYYEKVGDYNAIANIFIGHRSQIPYDISCYTAVILERAPQEVFDSVIFLATIHMRALMCQGRWKDAIKLAKFYEARYLKLPQNNEFKKLSLSSIYYCWGISRSLMCLSDDVYDFDLYFEKVDKCFSEPFDPGKLINQNPGAAWVCVTGSSRKGAPDEYVEVLKRSLSYLKHCYIGFETGKEDLACGELLFYRNDIDAAESYFARALAVSRESKQFGVTHRVLSYTLRISILKGSYARAEQALKEMKANLGKADYYNSYIDYDISSCWYYCILGLSEKTADWLKENFSHYAHASFTENFANQMKARYCYATRNYTSLLSYIEELKQRESFLFGRVEMLTIEACVYYKMKDKKKAFAILQEAYETAAPNNLIMPFIEMGKDMRTLTSSASKELGSKRIPRLWLETINRKSASYAKRQSHVATEYKQANRIATGIAISPRETDILIDLSHGLSRAEIAAGRNISINTVKMVISHIYSKLGAESLAEVIRIATEQKLI